MHTVTITNVSALGDYVTIEGNVDGVDLTANAWLTHLNSLADDTARQQFCASQLVAMLPPKSVTLTNLIPAGPLKV